MRRAQSKSLQIRRRHKKKKAPWCSCVGFRASLGAVPAALVLWTAYISVLVSQHTATHELESLLLLSPQSSKPSKEAADAVVPAKVQESTTASQSAPQILNSCFINANTRHIRSNVDNWRNSSVPLFSSIVQTFRRIPSIGRRKNNNNNANQNNNTQQNATKKYWIAYFSMIDMIWETKNHSAVEFFRTAEWYCNGKPATVLAGGKKTLGISIVCPNDDDDDGNDKNLKSMMQIPKPVNNIAVKGGPTYFVGDHLNCELHQPLKSPAATINSDSNVMVIGASLVFGLSPERVFEWVEYHRLIGVRYFYLYMMDTSSTTSSDVWPDVDYVTYVPWDLNPKMETTTDMFLFQTAAQADVIHRTRNLVGSSSGGSSFSSSSSSSSVWIVYNDVDEFLVLRNQDETLQTFLSSSASHRDTALALQTVTFGSNNRYLDGEDNSSNNKKVLPPERFTLNYTHRMEISFGHGRRSKCFVKPQYVDHYTIHFPSEPMTGNFIAVKPDVAWFHHYKLPQQGVFIGKMLKNKNITEDTKIRDKYLETVMEKVRNVLKTEG